MKERKYNDNGASRGNIFVLLTGMLCSLVGFVLAIIPLLMFFIPNGVPASDTPFVTVATYLNAFAIVLGIAGIIMGAHSASHNKAMTQVAAVFGSFAVILGLVMFILCLTFGAVIPLHNIV